MAQEFHTFFYRFNDRRQRRAGTMPAEHDDADRRVRCTPRLGILVGIEVTGRRSLQILVQLQH